MTTATKRRERRPGDLPMPGHILRQWRRHAFEHIWQGDAPLTCPRHYLDTEAILEPGRPLRALLSFDVNYHGSGWFKNADYEQCLHLSLSHPRPDRQRVFSAEKAGLIVPGSVSGIDVETPSEQETWAWAVAVFGPEHAPKAWLEPAASVFDPHRMPNIVHARLYYDRQHQVIQPEREVYSPLRPWSEKVLGSLGGDVR